MTNTVPAPERARNGTGSALNEPFSSSEVQSGAPNRPEHAPSGTATFPGPGANYPVLACRGAHHGREMMRKEVSRKTQTQTTFSIVYGRSCNNPESEGRAERRSAAGDGRPG